MSVAYYLSEAERYEGLAEKSRKQANRYRESQEAIKVGVLILDLDTDKTMRVTGLKNGSNDFEAKEVNGDFSRGYHYVVTNWKLVDSYE